MPQLRTGRQCTTCPCDADAYPPLAALNAVACRPLVRVVQGL